MSPVRSRRSGEAMFGSAGWLLADLMLALVVIVVLTIVIGQRKPSTTVHKAAVVTTTTTTTPPVTTTTAPPRLLPDPIQVNLDVNAAGLLRHDPGAIDATLQQAHGTLDGLLQGRRVGVVLAFGTAPNSNIPYGINLASAFDTLVLQDYGAQFTDSVYRAYFQGGSDQNEVSLTIWVFDQ